MGSVPWLCFAWTARIMVPRLGLTKMLWGCYPRCSAGKRNAIDGHASGVDHGGVAPPPPRRWRGGASGVIRSGAFPDRWLFVGTPSQGCAPAVRAACVSPVFHMCHRREDADLHELGRSPLSHVLETARSPHGVWGVYDGANQWLRHSGVSQARQTGDLRQRRVCHQVQRGDGQDLVIGDDCGGSSPAKWEHD